MRLAVALVALLACLLPSPARASYDDTHHPGLRFVLFHGDDGAIMSGDDSMRQRARQLRGAGNEAFLYFLRGDHEYVSRDPQLIGKVLGAWADMERIGEQQGELGRKQGELGRQQGELGRQQGKLALRQARSERDDRLSEQMHALGEKQRVLGDQQRVLGEQQRKLGEQQRAASEEAEAKCAELFAEAVRTGTAKKVQ